MTASGVTGAKCHRPGSEEGFSLVELMMVTVILGIVIAMAMAGLVSAQRASQADSDRVLNLDQARLLMDWTTRDLHTAVAVTSGQPAFTISLPFEAAFTGTFDTVSQPVLIHFYVVASQLIEQTEQPNCTPCAGPPYLYGSQPLVNRYVAQFISNSMTAPTQPIFVYSQSNATPGQPDVPIVPSGSGGTWTAGDRLLIHSVAIDYWVRHTSVFSVASTELKTRASLPNLDYNPNGTYSQ